jgi:ABC-type multidrug transport system ATPase subunit
MPALSIRSLRKSFLLGPAHAARRTEALAGVDLEVEEAEIVGIVGNEGVGKTSLLLCAAGLLCRDSGALYWFGERFGGGGILPGLAYVPAVPTYYPFLTVREVLDYYSEKEDIPARRRRSLIENLSARLGLADQLSTPVSELCVDALKRVGIAQSLAEEPRVILLDATLDGLAGGAAHAHRVIRDAATAGVTVIVTSRHAGILAPVATRILVMDAGRVTGSFAAEGPAQRMQASTVFAALSPQMLHIAERVH